MADEKFDWMMVDCPFKSFLFRFLWRIFKLLSWPFYFIFARIRLRKISSLHEELAKSKRVDIFPLQGGGRGFMLVLNQKDALYFYQNGDHFSYDGCEIGEYEKGDVTIFDHLES